MILLVCSVCVSGVVLDVLKCMIGEFEMGVLSVVVVSGLVGSGFVLVSVVCVVGVSDV